MTNALRDAELLSDAVEALAGGVAERRAMAVWEATRDRLSRRLFTTTDAPALDGDVVADRVPRSGAVG